MSVATTERIFNFSAGPAVLPLSALKKAQEELLCLPGAGASILEISHRGKVFEGILADAQARLKQLLGIGDDWQVMFLQGGATTQFSMVPLNFLKGSADYVACGAWASKAMDEARKCGTVNVVWDGKPEKYTRMPRQAELKASAGAAYLHVTSNETIEGVAFDYDPDTGGVPLVCDASSDFLSRPLDVSRYSLVYAGAQKNVGPAGATIVVVRKDFLEQAAGSQLPIMLDYKIMAKNDSMYNTPPTFAIYMIGLVLKWLQEEVGGLARMHQVNQEKARLLYDAIDQSGGYYRGHAKPDSRSLMNVTFRLPSEELETKFAREATARKLDGLKGHRSVGGMRASIYNAFPLEGVQALVEFMDEFRKANG
ncbi:MAG: 3-phosphoserine/phosphohydroxythreonine transaminase [Candidatus Eremiobacterota bacterium]